MEKKRRRAARKCSEYLFLWALGGSIYYLVEVAFRGFSHGSMFVLGGLALLFCTLQGQAMHWMEPLWLQLVRAVVFVTALEFITGILVNKWLRIGVWDYSDQPLQLFGQICVPFMVLFSGLLVCAILLGGTVAHRLFGEERPRFHIL